MRHCNLQNRKPFYQFHQIHNTYTLPLSFFKPLSL
nr:MAG TPA: hypothetical protein [Caudoviricetes sp.]